MLWRVPRSARLAQVALAVALTASAAAADESVMLDGVAAQVDGKIVLVSEVLRSVAPQEEAMRRAGAPESEIAKLRADGLERLIESRLIEEIVDKADLQASDEEIDRAIEGIAEENGLTLEQLYASVVFHGMSVEEYRAQIKSDFEHRNVVNAMVGQRVKVDDAEVRAFYDARVANQGSEGPSVHVRQILRAYGGPSKRDQKTACADAGEARSRVLAGEPFEQVAAQVSEVAPRDGGDIGWLPLKSVAPWMSEALKPLEPGDLSEVLVLPFGCAVLQLVEQKVLEPVSFEQAKERISQQLWEQMVEKEYRKWMEELRARSYIERRGYFADAANFGDSTFPVRGAPAKETAKSP
jgi:peptidyl-prolyl cis-trans isomerase SurA